MNRARPVIVIVLLLGAAVVAWRLLGGPARERTLSGYVEGESLYLAAPVAGTIGSVSALEGARVAPGQSLFTIEPAALSAQGQQARATVAAARTQIAAAEANADQADAEVAAAAADAERARADLSRLQRVRAVDPAAVAGRDIDQAQAAVRQASARVAAAREAAQARRAQVAAARAQAEEASGGEREVQIRVSQLSPVAPVPARVEQVFFQPGEWVSANQPVVALLPDDRVKLRFFVPVAEVARYRPGRTVRFSCDGCQEALQARIRYVSPRPEFTPPVIFSRDSRDRLVFLVEASPVRSAAGLMPGLPIDVEPLP